MFEYSFVGDMEEVVECTYHPKSGPFYTYQVIVSNYDDLSQAKSAARSGCIMLSEMDVVEE